MGVDRYRRGNQSPFMPFWQGSMSKAGRKHYAFLPKPKSIMIASDLV
jgi:hypothetical protein